MARARLKKYHSSIPRESRDTRNLDQELFSRLVRGSRGARVPYYSEAQSRIDQDSAMSLTGVYSAINRISSDMAMIPLQVKRKRPDGSKQVVEDHPVNQVLKYTWDGGETTSFYSKRQAMGYCLGWGQAIGVIEWDRWGRVTGIQHHHPRYAAARRDSNCKLYYTVQGLNRQVLDLPPERVLHFKNYACYADNGDSPILLGRPALALYSSAEAHAQSSHSNGGNMRGFFTTDQEMTPEEVEEYLAAVAAEHSGPENANKYGVLQGGMKWVATTFSPEATQLLASRTFSIQDVCRLFSIYPHKLAEMSNSTFSNIEELNRQYVDMTLMSWITMWEAECNLKLFSAAERAAGYCVEFDVEVFIRGNSLAQAQVDKELLACGVINRNEVRAKRGFGPIPGGDAYIIQSNQGTLEQVINGDFVGKGSQPTEGANNV